MGFKAQGSDIEDVADDGSASPELGAIVALDH